MMKKNRLTAIAFVMAAVCCAANAAAKPNVIIILNDDQGYQDLGCYGSPDERWCKVYRPHVSDICGKTVADVSSGAPGPSHIFSDTKAFLLTQICLSLGFRRLHIL